MALTPITLESTDRVNMLIIGKAGIGKTSLIRTIPEDQKVCVLSAESGLLCVRDLVQAGKVEGFEIGSFADFKEAYRLLNTDRAVQERYAWVFIDSLTEIAGRCAEAMKAKYPSKSDSFSLWGEYTDLMTLLIKGFRDLKAYNVVFTCLETIELDEAKRRHIAPAIAGKQLQERLTSYFDEVLFMSAFNRDDGSEYRAFVTQPWERFPGKDRSGKLDLIEKPDLDHVRQKILNGECPF
jgi:hypothetical protein